jgi:hypothetical protein
MVRITIDDELKRRLSESGKLVEIVDTNGRLVGKFVPETDGSDEWEVVYPKLSEEELNLRLHSAGPTYTMKQVKEYLGKRK